jgi:polyisoprenoid-binding protein YceI
VWQLDPAHSSAEFAIKHLAISTVRGAFTKLSGSVHYDAADASKDSVDVTIDAASVDTRVENRDKDLRGPNYFDVEKYPTITFKSKKVESAGPEKLKIVGDLMIHGVTKEVTLDTEGPTKAIKDGRGRSHMGASATTKINRSDFGMTSGQAMVGNEVTLTLDVDLVQGGGGPPK